MTIPEKQLETWSTLGGRDTAKTTHESIQLALSKYSWSEKTGYQVNLQGSYKNYTNIRGDSDVDIVVLLTSVWYSNLDSLSESEKSAYKSLHYDSDYNWRIFRQDNLSALHEYYGVNDVIEGDKTLKLMPNNNRLPADIVVCVEYRKYLDFVDLHNNNYIQGIKFWDVKNNNAIINFPKLHYDNSSTKNGKTDRLYRKFIRIIKNARRKLVNDGLIEKDTTPSYFLECLLYNIPNDCYKNSYRDIFLNVLNYLSTNSWDKFVCPNEQLLLFGDNHDQWNTRNAEIFVKELSNMWDNWNN